MLITGELKDLESEVRNTFSRLTSALLFSYILLLNNSFSSFWSCFGSVRRWFYITSQRGI